ncbi:glycosyltransferase [Pseudoalteromonas sp. TAE56]|uniref:glycosyltransferase n=1 Tax=Pseudoalteromonas sp. TAE56 TaxID=1938596 RepID=UPI00041DC4DC|nr:glycosyltransferase [Pseudoalteromonas sp. TAE56]
MFNLSIGISTVKTNSEQAINLAFEILKADKSNFVNEVIIMAQFESENSNEILTEKVKLFKSMDKGLSKSRNFLMSNSSSDYIWLLDDDVSISEEQIKNVEAIINNIKYECTDVFIGKILTAGTSNTPFKNYSKERKGIIGLLQTSSIEIILNRNFIVENNIKYDERLGLGAMYPCGEENFFLIDTWNKKAKFKFLDIFTLSHPKLELPASSTRYFLSEDQINAKILILRALPTKLRYLYFLKVSFRLLMLKKFKLLMYFFKNCKSTNL